MGIEENLTKELFAKRYVERREVGGILHSWGLLSIGWHSHLALKGQTGSGH